MAQNMLKSRSARPARAVTSISLQSGKLSEPEAMAVATRAYELYVAGGCQDGHDQEHWYRAERELVELRGRD